MVKLKKPTTNCRQKVVATLKRRYGSKQLLQARAALLGAQRKLSGDGRNIFPVKVSSWSVAPPCDSGIFEGLFFSALGGSKQGHPLGSESLFAL